MYLIYEVSGNLLRKNDRLSNMVEKRMRALGIETHEHHGIRTARYGRDVTHAISHRNVEEVGPERIAVRLEQGRGFHRQPEGLPFIIVHEEMFLPDEPPGGGFVQQGGRFVAHLQIERANNFDMFLSDRPEGASQIGKEIDAVESP